jgi:threonine/homoserine/homoserine lactone efflux protein
VTAQARSAGRALFIICGVNALIVAVVFVLRLHSGGVIAPLSVALPLLGLLWLLVLGVQVWRYRAPVDAAPARQERPSKRPPRFDPGTGVRADRPSDSGTHASA